MNDGIKIDGVLRLIGIMAVAIAAAWLVQVLDFGGSSALGKLVWVVSAAAVAGGGTGLIFTSGRLRKRGETASA